MRSPVTEKCMWSINHHMDFRDGISLFVLSNGEAEVSDLTINDTQPLKPWAIRQ